MAKFTSERNRPTHKINVIKKWNNMGVPKSKTGGKITNVPCVRKELDKF